MPLRLSRGDLGRAARTAALLALLGAGALGCAGPAAQPSPPAAGAEVRATLADFRVEAPATTFRVGVPYRFVVANAGTVNHEFMVAPPPGPGEPPEDLDRAALARIDDDDFPPGSTKAITVTFGKPAAAGALELACHVPGHYEKGMRAPITVVP